METYGQHPAPSHVIAHLSDPHLLAGSLQYGVIDTAAHLGLALDQLTRINPAPQALVFTGDLADKGQPEAYARLRDTVAPIAASMGAEVVWVMGNHDDRAGYSEALYGDRSEAPQDRVHEIDGLRVIALDTTVPGFHHGELSDEQLTWLAGVLATPAPHGTILALHHPPIPVPMLPIAAVIELLDQDRLAAVVRDTDVRAIIGGHFHFTSHSTFAGIPVSVASATCYTSDVTPVDRIVSGVDGHQAFSMLHVYDDRIVHSVVPVADAPEVSGQPIEAAELLAALTPEERFDLISRKDSDLNKGA